MSKALGIPKGMRDFSPQVMQKRNYIFETIRSVFQLYGFEQIETPAMENRETLTGKYGEEGDRLIFNVLNSGEFLSKTTENELNPSKSISLLPKIADKALRYDLTVPFARYVVQHQNEISRPFKRFQIQSVWRADRPQKGRYREFFQCDADIIGSNSLLNELELIQIFDEVLSNLGLSDFSIKINNRKILSGIAEVIGRPDQIVDLTIAIDKLDKIGKENVLKELQSKGFKDADITQIEPLFALDGTNAEILQMLEDYLKDSDIGLKGIEELKEVLSYFNQIRLKRAKIEVDVTLARGLDYYTGAIFEVISNEVKMGSICGGGRYDDLTGIFGLKDMSGVGISFGADRIYDVMEELKLFPEKLISSSQVLFVNFGKKEELYILPILKQFRENSINAELFPEAAKLAKQMKYADKKQIPYVILIGEEEMNNETLTVKEMNSGHQDKMQIEDALKRIANG